MKYSVGKVETKSDVAVLDIISDDAFSLLVLELLFLWSNEKYDLPPPQRFLNGSTATTRRGDHRNATKTTNECGTAFTIIAPVSSDRGLISLSSSVATAKTTHLCVQLHSALIQVLMVADQIYW